MPSIRPSVLSAAAMAGTISSTKQLRHAHAASSSDHVSHDDVALQISFKIVGFAIPTMLFDLQGDNGQDNHCDWRLEGLVRGEE